MKLTRISKIIFGLTCLGIVVFFSLNLNHGLLKSVLEITINRTSQEFFNDSVHMDKAALDLGLKLHIENLRFNLQSENGPVPIAIREIDSKSPLTDIFRKSGIAFSFKGAHVQSSRRVGVNGAIHVVGIQKWKIHLETDYLDIDLDDLIWLNPDNLLGSTGQIEGKLTLDANVSGKADLTADFQIKSPGGNLQGKFFGLIMPYLPPQAAKNAIKQLASSGGLVRYKTAGLNLNLIRSNQLKVVLKILIPDYNLDLNLNLILRLEDQNSITDLAQLMGIVKAK